MSLIKNVFMGAVGVLAFMNISVADEKLSIERITTSPALSGNAPKGLKFSPDGKRVTFLKASAEDYKVLDLWEYNLAEGASRLLVKASSITGGEEKLSQVERARRERMRITAKGIVSYSWDRDGSKLLFPLGGDLYQYDLSQGVAKRLTHSESYETDSRFSPKGTYVSYIEDYNIHVVDVEKGRHRQLTKSRKSTIKNGSAEFIAMEEMDRDTGYWWSPDEKYIAFIRFDEAPVQIGSRYEISRNDFKVLEERYPKTGSNNVTVKLGIMTVKSKRVKWIDLGEESDIYLPRVNWLPDSSGIFFQRQNRAQTRLELIFANAKTAKTRPVLEEKSDLWINLHHNLKFLKNGEEFIWSSERSGFMHLYHYKIDGSLIGQLTAGDWVITGLSNVDEKTDTVYFTGNADTPIEHHLYKTSLGDHKVENPVRITKSGGWHSVTFPDNGTDYIDSYSDPATPDQVSLQDATGKHITWIEENKLTEGHPYFAYTEDHIIPEFGKFAGPSGDDLHYRLYKPSNMEEGKKYPVIVALYGGPHAQLVRRQWGDEMHQILAQSGYVIFTLDNRGSNYRGVAFEGAINRRLGKVEVEDQVAGVNFLKTLDFVDPDRIGVQGHSYGGYMALMSLFTAPDVFKVGVSGAPVTEWRLYDTHYTERYLGRPQDNAQGYDQSSVFPYVGNLTGKLLLIHGMADDNVLFNNSSMLVDEMQKNAIQFDFMAYPGQTHRIGSDKMRKRHFLHLMKRYFDENL